MGYQGLRQNGLRPPVIPLILHSHNSKKGVSAAFIATKLSSTVGGIVGVVSEILNRLEMPLGIGPPVIQPVPVFAETKTTRTCKIAIRLLKI